MILSFFRAVLVVCALAGLAFAQSEVGTGTINGTVSDASGAVVAGAKVTATNRNTGLVRETVTSDAGVYTFLRLPVGSYDLRVEAAGFKSLNRTDIDVAVGSLPTVDVELEVGNVSESVTVSDVGAPVVETTRSQTSTVVNEKLIRDLPINGRNFLDFTTLTPGVVRDPRGGDLSFGGQRGTLNSLLIDGADSNNTFFGQSAGRQGVRNPYAVSQDAVQEFQVNTNSYSAEIGRAGGGVVNVITKSGTNDLHGTGFFFYRHESLNANNAIRKAAGQPRQPYRFKQFGGNLGGPVVKDKLFWFFNYDGQRNSDPINVFSLVAPSRLNPADLAVYNNLLPYFESYSRGLNNDVYLGKADWNIASNKTLSVRYTGNRFVGRNYENSGSQRAPESTGDSRVTTDGVTAAYTHVLGSTTVWDSRFSVLRDDQPGAANSDAPETTIRQGGQNIITFGRNNFSPRYTNAKNYQIIQTLSTVRGAHTLKFGGDLNLSRISNFFPGQFSGVYVFESLQDYANRRPTSFSQALPGADTPGPLSQPNLTEFALFAQDQWRTTDRLTLNLGVRYDIMRTAEPEVRNQNTLLEAAGFRTDRIPLDGNNLGYRFGFAYKPFNTETFVLRGGSGMFYARIPAILTGTIHTQNGIQVQNYEFRGAAIPVTYPNILAAAPSVNRTPNIFVSDPNLRNPLTYQWSFNVETQLAPDYALTLGYLGVKGQHLTRSRDINLGTPVLTNGSIAGGGSFQFLRYPTARPNPAFGRITLVDSGADSVYHGAFVQLTKRFSHNFQMQASYTFSKVLDDAPDATAVLPNNGGDDAKIVMYTTLPHLDRGIGDADVPHRFVGSLVWDINYAKGLDNPVLRRIIGDYQISTILQASSGYPYSQRVSTDINNDGNRFNDRVPFIGRNTERRDAFAQWDLRVSRDFPFTERLRLRIMAEAFNLTNSVFITGVNQTAYQVSNTFVLTPNPLYGFRTAVADPRYMQLAAKIIF